MDKYTIYCTSKQTKKALELGASIERRSDNYDHSNRYFRFKLHPGKYGGSGYYYAKCPTTEQMISWLEGQGLLISITARNTPDNPIYNYNINRCEEFWGTFSSRKEATLAAIDASLEYLIDIKK